MTRFRYLVKDFEFSFQVLIEFQNGCLVSHSIAIVGCTPNCHQILFSEPVLISFVCKLVSSADQLESIEVVEIVNDFISE